MDEIIFSLDVESVGLYGDAFSVGVSVVDENNKEIDNLFLRADHHLAKGLDSGRKWIEQNVIPNLENINCESLYELRSKFWNFYKKYNLKYPTMKTIADCGVPCEANFFRQCILDDLEARIWDGPFPLYEVGTLLILCGINPQASHERLSNELPIHNPLCDARQSARLWLECKQKLLNK